MLVKALKERGTMLRIVETGCGTALTSLLLNQEGASAVLYDSYIPYSKGAEQQMIGEFAEGERSVSAETVRKMMKHYVTISPKNVNTIFISSFQLATHASPETYTHGWVGIWYKDGDVRYYHVTMPKISFISRELLVEEIGSVCSQLLLEGKASEVDIILNEDLSQDIYGMVEMIVQRTGKNDSMIFYQNGKFVRPQDLLRNPSYLIYKGSFNPFTKMHDSVVKDGEKSTGKDVYLMVSISSQGKESLTVNDILFKLEQADAIGRPIIISKKARFAKTIEHLRNVYGQQRICFLVGTDTMERIIAIELDFETSRKYAYTSYYVAERGESGPWPERDCVANKVTVRPVLGHIDDGTSSTMVCAAIASNDFEAVSKMIPERTFDIVKKNFNTIVKTQTQ